MTPKLAPFCPYIWILHGENELFCWQNMFGSSWTKLYTLCTHVQLFILHYRDTLRQPDLSIVNQSQKCFDWSNIWLEMMMEKQNCHVLTMSPWNEGAVEKTEFVPLWTKISMTNLRQAWQYGGKLSIWLVSISGQGDTIMNGYYRVLTFSVPLVRWILRNMLWCLNSLNTGPDLIEILIKGLKYGLEEFYEPSNTYWCFKSCDWSTFILKQEITIKKLTK